MSGRILISLLIYLRIVNARTGYDEMILVNKGLEVSVGRWVVVESGRHLLLGPRSPGPEDRCVVRVLHEEQTSWIGRLSPDEFPCHFTTGDVTYTHYGDRTAVSDRVSLLLRHDSPRDTAIIPFTLTVNVQPLSKTFVAHQKSTLTVKRSGGRSQALTNSVLQLKYDRKRYFECFVSVLRGPGVTYPRYGQLVRADSESFAVATETCDDFLDGKIYYQHRFNLTSGKYLNKDRVPLMVEVKDWPNGGGQPTREFLQLTVSIEDGVENTPPRISYSSLLLMDVSQFVLTPVTIDIISGSDAESGGEELLFRLTSPSPLNAEVEGCLVSTDDQHMAVSRFTQRDVEQLKIAYAPPVVNTNEQRIIPIGLEIVDGDGMVSEPFTLLVNVKPMNTKAPVATKNTGMSLFEGQSRPLRSASNLQISDADNIDDVTIHVVHGLRHGKLYNQEQKEISNFSSSDLDAGVIKYQHDGSESYADNIVFRLKDGQHIVDFLFVITIFPVDDQPPFLLVNTGLTLHKSLEAELGPFVLSAEDADSEDDDEVKFVLEQPGPAYGQLFLRYADGESEEAEVVVVDEWSQNDVVEGRLHYRHLGQHHSQVVMDAINFRLRDSRQPPNWSKEQQFLVKILPLDDLPPRPHPSASLILTVREFELTPLSLEQLRFTDGDDTDDRWLRYTVQVPPFDMDANSPNRQVGSIVSIDHPDVQLTTFTQLQINHRKVAFQPPTVELGLTPIDIKFTFDVEDEAGNVATGHSFHVQLLPINNQPPSLYNAGSRVTEGGSVIIGTDVIDATDADTEQQQLWFRVISEPRHGQLMRNNTVLLRGDFFTRVDLTSKSLSYVHGGDESVEDVLNMELSDGVHLLPFALKVKVKPVDDQRPWFVNGNGTVSLSCNESGYVVIQSEPLRATDVDTDDQKLIFKVEKYPSHGKIMLKSNGGVVTRFSQRHLEQGNVVYRHIGKKIGKRPIIDSFTLSLSDQSNATQQINISVTLEVVDNQSPNVTVLTPLLVDEGGKRSITGDVLKIDDVDSGDDQIVCTILVQPVRGYVENTAPSIGSERSRAGFPITAFQLEDVHRSTINYVQSIRWNEEPTMDSLNVECSDGVNVSPPTTLSVVIRPVNDETPKIFVGDFEVFEGMHLYIDETILNAVDADVPGDHLRFVVTRKPRHGRLVFLPDDGSVEVTSFEVDSLRRNSQPTLTYSHDDSETLEDEFELELSDGDATHAVKKLIKVRVVPTDDETPTMAINRGLELRLGEEQTITNRHLKAVDVDSDHQTLIYVIQMAPRHGQLIIKADEMNVTVGGNFSQGDIDRGAVSYVHTREEGAGRDLIKFDVTDGVNYLLDCYFYVTIDGGDVIYPDVVSRGLKLSEGGRVRLTTDVLSTSDIDSDDRWLTFTLTQTPAKGHLESSDHQGEPIVTFTQLDLAGNKIVYVHTAEDESKADSFEFEVSDGYNAVYRTFRITINQKDNKKPVLYMMNEMKVREGAVTPITPFELKAEDRDTEQQLLRFIVTRPPSHGVLLLAGVELTAPSDSFTMLDVDSGLLSYQHDGSESGGDSIGLTVTDGSHRDFFLYPDMERETSQPVTLAVTVLPVDDEPPQLTINRPSMSIGRLQPPARQPIGVRISNRSLRAADIDSPVTEIRYAVTDQPRHGRLTNGLNGNNSLTAFTQGDVDEGRIYYVLLEGENSTEDNFRFKLIDKGGNENGEHVYTLHWAWIEMEAEMYTVNETDPYVKVVINRRGHLLAETSFVGVTTEDVTTLKNRDYRPIYAKQVQFNPGQSRATWKLLLLDNSRYEGSKQLKVTLVEPLMAVLREERSSCLITIIDHEDEATVELVDEQVSADENVGEFSLSVERSGDVSTELSVVCFTRPGSAVGTSGSGIFSFSDYISQRSVVHFQPNQTIAKCPVIVIDDAVFESDEEFYVLLANVSGGMIGAQNRTKVVIKKDPNDTPQIYFGESSYAVSESEGQLEVTLRRGGTDLSHKSSVIVQSRSSSAESGKDYLGVNLVVEFEPGDLVQSIKLTILDDLGGSIMEGAEVFRLTIKVPVNCTIVEPSSAVVYIDDSAEDSPSVQFKEAEFTVEENDGQMSVLVERNGDLREGSTVYCYTRQATARVQQDFIERPMTDESAINFLPGESERPCVVQLIDDDTFESDEVFTLALGHSSTSPELKIGPINVTTVTIKDSSDIPVIGFDKTRYDVREPKRPGQSSVAEVVVVRQGDLNFTSVVRVHTKDGSAKSGEDYNAFSTELKLGPNVSRVVVPIDILYDSVKEQRETLIVQLKAVDDDQSEKFPQFKDVRSIVYIEGDANLADVTFPSRPIVTSLRDYDEGSSRDIPAGYPVVCITSCHFRHPEFSKTGSLCSRQGVNDSLTEFEWRLSSLDGTMYDLTATSFFTSVHKMTLDSVYLTAGSRVQCVARAVNVDGSPGVQMASQPVEISKTRGLCPPRIIGLFGSEPFTAKLRYTGSEDLVHPNMVKLSVTIPHRDGLLPLISTRPLSSFQTLLGRDTTFRQSSHPCSNLLQHSELRATNTGFLAHSIKDTNVIGEVEPHQFSAKLRTEPTLRFYRSLDLESCTWEFESHYSMSELVHVCGATITSNDGQVRNETQSYVNVRVPLYVSYAFYSGALGSGGWQHSDHHTQLLMKFVYDTSAVWREGISSSVGDQSLLQATLYPTSMRIEDDGQLLVHFVTESKFHGRLLLKHPGAGTTSFVTSHQHPDLTFTLLKDKEDPVDSNRQHWLFHSNYAVKDYSGIYHINIFPCVYTSSSDNPPPVCVPRPEPISFELRVRFQQVSDPVASEYSLSTRFELSRHQHVWSTVEDDVTDVSFLPNDVIYGRLEVDPVQNLGSSFDLEIERCVLCCGVVGYVPKYDPDLGEFGCLARSPHLMHVITIIDERFPDNVDVLFHDVPLNARLAPEHNVSRGRADAFQFDATPLFMASSGRQWFVQCVYNIRPSGERHRRSVSEVDETLSGIGEDGRGTNMHPFHLSYQSHQPLNWDPQSGGSIWSAERILILLAVVLCLLVITVLGFFCLKRFRLGSSPSRTPHPHRHQNLNDKPVITKRPQIILNEDNTEV